MGTFSLSHNDNAHTNLEEKKKRDTRKINFETCPVEVNARNVVITASAAITASATRACAVVVRAASVVLARMFAVVRRAVSARVAITASVPVVTVRDHFGGQILYV